MHQPFPRPDNKRQIHDLSMVAVHLEERDFAVQCTGD
jgi:hypothetical protein